ncbi:MAG TPA: hypothetical protein DIT63_06650 [Gammaproteobacteria bacterium]|nr:hypothetical protein [Gammaproteobacteria bacterium]
MAALQAHDWPGNVRELENLVRRFAALYSDEVITIDIVERELVEPVPAPAEEHNPASESLGAAIEYHLSQYFDAHGEDLPPPGLYDRVLRELERPLINLSLSATRGNQLRAAELLGLNRNTLRKKLQQYGL